MVERTPNKSQHTKSTLEKKILPPLLPGFELATFRLRVRRSNQHAIPDTPTTTTTTTTTTTAAAAITTTTTTTTEPGWLVGKSAGLMIERLEFDARQERRENVLLQS